MIIKFNIFENINHSDLDPYGEEIWEEPVFSFEKGEIVTCVEGSHVLKVGEKYVIDDIYMDLDGEFVNVTRLKTGDKHTGYFSKRFIKVRVDENAHNELDPYGEEDWGEPVEFKEGDIVVCIGKDWNNRQIEIGEEYVCAGPSYELPHNDGKLFIDVVKSNGLRYGGYHTWKFKLKKDVNENIDHSDIDPYGEEEWDEPVEFKEGDIVVCVDPSHDLKYDEDYMVRRCEISYNVAYVSVENLESDIRWNGMFAKRFKLKKD